MSKGSLSRVRNKKTYDSNFDKISRPVVSKKEGKSVKTKKGRVTRYIYK